MEQQKREIVIYVREALFHYIFFHWLNNKKFKPYYEIKAVVKYRFYG